MAIRGSGVVPQTIDPKMEDRIKHSPVDPRSGNAKHIQTSFQNVWGMKDQTEASKLHGASPTSPGFNHAPDASSPNPLDLEPKPKKLIKRPKSVMKDANGRGVDGDLGRRILADAGRIGRRSR